MPLDVGARVTVASGRIMCSTIPAPLHRIHTTPYGKEGWLDRATPPNLMGTDQAA